MTSSVYNTPSMAWQSRGAVAFSGRCARLTPGVAGSPGAAMAVEFTNNARTRMQEREIAEADIRAVLDAPDSLVPTFENHWHARRRLRDRTLEVLFVRDLTHQRVVTAYWQEA